MATVAFGGPKRAPRPLRAFTTTTTMVVLAPHRTVPQPEGSDDGHDGVDDRSCHGRAGDVLAVGRTNAARPPTFMTNEPIRARWTWLTSSVRIGLELK